MAPLFNVISLVNATEEERTRNQVHKLNLEVAIDTLDLIDDVLDTFEV
jgi:hypothetical protein